MPKYMIEVELDGSAAAPEGIVNLIDETDGVVGVKLLDEVACCREETKDRVFKCSCPRCEKIDKIKVSKLPVKRSVLCRPVSANLKRLLKEDLKTLQSMAPIALITKTHTEEEALEQFHKKHPLKRPSDFEIKVEDYQYQELVKVYFESSSHGEAVAVFYGEHNYQTCLAALEEAAAEGRMEVTESVVHTNHDLFEVVEEYLEC